MSNPVPAAESHSSHHSKLGAALLALVLGVLGAHRLYLGARWWWIYPVVSIPSLTVSLAQKIWYREPAFFVFALVAVVCALESILFCLTPDARWDEAHNAHSDRRSANGVGTVLIASVALLAGTILLLSVLALAFEGFFTARLGQ